MSENWPLYTVRTLADSGSGSLRSACYGPQPRRVHFAVDGVIQLHTDILCDDNKDVRADDRMITVTGGAIRFVQSSNFRVSGICFKGVPDDAVEIRESANGVVEGCTFKDVGDGAVDIVRGSTNVSVLRNVFKRTQKTSLVGNNDDLHIDGITRVTYHGNVFDHIGARAPRVRHGLAHSCGNVYVNWSSYAIGGSANGTAAVENGYFHGTRPPFKRFDASFSVYSSGNNHFFDYHGPLVKGKGSKDTDEGFPGVPYVCPVLSEKHIIAGAGAGPWCT